MTHPSNFRSPAYRTLIKTLGEADATVEWIEVGVREIIHTYEAEGAETIQKLADGHGICVVPIEISELQNRCARLQILSVYQQLEFFLKNFRKTHPRKVQFSRKNDEDILTATLRSFSIGDIDAGKLECEIFHYYRIIRNKIMHDPETVIHKEIEKKCNNLREAIKKSGYDSLSAPNNVNALCFDDFVLLTRSGKQLASNLCELTSPTDEELLATVQDNVDLLKKKKKLENNKERSRNMISGFFQEKYSIPKVRAMDLSKMFHDPLAQR